MEKIEDISISNSTNEKKSLSELELELERDRVRVKRKSLQAVLEQCQRALELLNSTEAVDGCATDPDDDVEVPSSSSSSAAAAAASGSASADTEEADELCDLLKSRVECPDFLEKLESAQASFPQKISEEASSWDVVSEKDLWEGENEDYVLVRQEDIVEGIACFMAAYLLSLKQTKDVTPNQLQEALSKTFAVKKKKGKLRKALDGSKVIYNVASWGATAIGIYQNPVILRVASKAFWTSCHAISKFL